MTPNTPMTELPVDDLETAVRAFMPLAQVAFLWTHEASPPEDEIQRYRDAYHNVLRALRQSDTRIEGGGEPVAWVTADILAAMKRGDRAVPGWKRSEEFCIPLYATPPANKSPTPEHVEGDVLSVGEMEVVAWKMPGAGKTLGKAGWAFITHQENPEDYEPGEYEALQTDIANAIPLVTLASATTRIQRAERERDALLIDCEEYKNAGHGYYARALKAEAQLADAVTDFAKPVQAQMEQVRLGFACRMPNMQSAVEELMVQTELALSAAQSRIQHLSALLGKFEQEKESLKDEVIRAQYAHGEEGVNREDSESRATTAEAQLADAVKVLNQCRLAFAGMVSVQSAIDMLDRASEISTIGEKPDAE